MERTKVRRSILLILLFLAVAVAMVITSNASPAFAVEEDDTVPVEGAEETEETEGIDIREADISGIKDKIYSGNKIVQSFTVKIDGTKLKKGRDYTVSYSNNRKVGTATVTIEAVEGSGYYGYVNRTFRIRSRVSKNVTVSDYDLMFQSDVMYDDPLSEECLPRNLMLTGIEDGIRLSWKMPLRTSDIDGYVILRRANGSVRYQEIGTVGKNATTFVDKTANHRNQLYVYTVVACQKQGGQMRITPAACDWVAGVTSNSTRTNVYNPVFKTKPYFTLSVGKSRKMKVSFPAGAKTKKMRWSSSDPAVAYVSSNGTVTAKRSGHAYIYAMSATGRVRSFRVTVPEENTVMKGIDVSYAQGKIDWEKVRADGIEFAFIRCGFRGRTTNELTTDEWFKYNIKNAKKADIKVGVYFFTQATTYEEGVEEAEYVYMLTNSYHLDLPVVIDTEDSGAWNGRADGISKADRTAAVKGFCERTRQLGRTPMIYASRSWFHDRLNMEELPYQVWVAEWGDECTYSGEYKCWQYTDSGSVDGISSRYVDMDYWYN